MFNRFKFWLPLRYCFTGEFCHKEHDIIYEHPYRTNEKAVRY